MSMGSKVRVVEDVSEIPDPGLGEVRVKVLACGAAYTDTLIRRGIYPDVKQKPSITLGYDMIGILDKVGKVVTELAEWDKVTELTILGSYAEFMILRAKQLVHALGNL